ncbi:MAG: hypothetical protein IIU08_00150, partial [Clostridia bacterium]|nr:hypothetical protein [Clostridia bacterium]
QNEITIVSRETLSGKPHSVPFPCAPESLPEAAELVLRMFRLYFGDQAGLAPCSGPSNPQSV